MTGAVLHLVCGLPGSGKTTFAKALEESGSAIRLAPDEWLHVLDLDFYDEAARANVEQLQWKLAQKLLRLGNDVILENGFWTKAERDTYRTTARNLGASTRLHFLDVPLTELKARVARRNEGRQDDIPFVDPARLDEWAAMFEPPEQEELGLDGS